MPAGGFPGMPAVVGRRAQPVTAIHSSRNRLARHSTADADQRPENLQCAMLFLFRRYACFEVLGKTLECLGGAAECMGSFTASSGRNLSFGDLAEMFELKIDSAADLFKNFFEFGHDDTLCGDPL